MGYYSDPNKRADYYYDKAQKFFLQTQEVHCQADDPVDDDNQLTDPHNGDIYIFMSKDCTRLMVGFRLSGGRYDIED